MLQGVFQFTWVHSLIILAVAALAALFAFKTGFVNSILWLLVVVAAIVTGVKFLGLDGSQS